MPSHRLVGCLGQKTGLSTSLTGALQSTRGGVVGSGVAVKSVALARSYLHHHLRTSSPCTFVFASRLTRILGTEHSGLIKPLRKLWPVIIMAHLYLNRDVLQASFPHPAASANFPSKATPYQARPELYGAFSVVDDAKDKARQLGNEASRELNKATPKGGGGGNGKIELYSGMYYASCTFGGLLACVGASISLSRYSSSC